MTTDPASSDREAVMLALRQSPAEPSWSECERLADAVLAALAERGVSRQGINAAIAVGYEAARADTTGEAKEAQP